MRMVTRAEYAAVAFSSTDKQNRCWDAQWLEQSVDLPAVGLHFFLRLCSGISGQGHAFLTWHGRMHEICAELAPCTGADGVPTDLLHAALLKRPCSQSYAQ